MIGMNEIGAFIFGIGLFILGLIFRFLVEHEALIEGIGALIPGLLYALFFQRALFVGLIFRFLLGSNAEIERIGGLILGLLDPMPPSVNVEYAAKKRSNYNKKMRKKARKIENKAKQTAEWKAQVRKESAALEKMKVECAAENRASFQAKKEREKAEAEANHKNWLLKNSLEQAKKKREKAEAEANHKKWLLKNSLEQDLVISLISVVGFMKEGESKGCRANEKVIDTIRAKFTDKIILILHGVFQSLSNEMLTEDAYDWVEPTSWSEEVLSRVMEEFPDMSSAENHHQLEWSKHGIYMALPVEDFFVRCIDFHQNVNHNNSIARQLIRRLEIEGDKLRQRKQLFDSNIGDEHYQLIEASVLREMFHDILNVWVILDVRLWPYSLSCMGFSSHPRPRKASSSSAGEIFYFYGVRISCYNSGLLKSCSCHAVDHYCTGKADRATCHPSSLVLLI